MTIDYRTFVTPFDKWPENVARRDENEARGLTTGNNALEFHIAITGVWSTRNKDGSRTQSYETLGYHANTAYFFKGILASGCKIIDHRIC